ncbi:hypothetical protein BU15DRAFT_66638 [Melanogaster broomeanus]|nr:hypothetical protein BU15DRAFT_66638 [Melanogaster broomeanus]
MSLSGRGVGVGACVGTGTPPGTGFCAGLGILTRTRTRQACPRLYELALDTHSLRKFNKFKFDPVVLTQLKESGQGIRSLKLVTHDTAWPILSQLLGIWPRIQFLKVYQWFTSDGPLLQQHPDSISDIGWEGASVALYELSFLGCVGRTTFYHAPLPWLLASSSHSLCILHLDILPKAGTAARTMLELHAPRLRSLHLPIYDMDEAVFIHRCTVLEELFVDYHLSIPLPASALLP